MTRPPKVYLRTYGCQMNKYDSAVVLELLSRQGYEETRNPEDADLILLNTCSVREHAEKRAVGRANNLAYLKAGNPNLLLGVIGCVAQSRGTGLLKDAPAIDLVVGPDCYRELPRLVEELRGSGRSAVLNDARDSEMYEDLKPRTTGVCSFLPVMRGCNNFCSYCVVPFTRGRERSRPAADVVREVARLAQSGVRDITLIGQNVNSYQDSTHGFSDLLRMVDPVAGDARIRFITSHPRDFGTDMMAAMADCTSVCEHIHLPLQSGSSRVLELMNRGYTLEEYLRKVETARSLVDGLSITTDILVGFPGETEDDFRLTLSAVEKIGFDFAYMFAYSPRDETRASSLEGQVARTVRHERLKRLINVQNPITADKNRSLVSTVTEILVEGDSSHNSNEKVGRSRTNKSVVFRGGAHPGDLVLVEVEELRGWTPYGRVLDSRGKGAADVGRS